MLTVTFIWYVIKRRHGVVLMCMVLMCKGLLMLIEIFSYDFMQRAIMAVIAISIFAPI